MSTASRSIEADKYFSAYEDMQVHRIMLSDKPRLDAYKRAILTDKHLFKEKVVMDVGAGTGILSLFCALAGARKIYAVEASSLAVVVSDVVKENEYSDIIEVLHQKVEDVCLPDDAKVDIIVSEWMGFHLLHESMLDSVIVARDKFLKPNGKLFPDKAILYAAPCSTPASLVAEIQKDKEFWADVSGFKMNSIFYTATRERFETPEVSTLVLESDLLSSGTKLFTLDLTQVSSNELDLLEARKFISVDRDGEYGGVCIWFDCVFPNLSECFDNVPADDLCSDVNASTRKDPSDVILSTSPCSPPTHWKQTLIIWPHQSAAAVGGVMGNRGSGTEGGECTERGGVADRADDDVPCSSWTVESGEVVGFYISLRRDPVCHRRYVIQLEALDPAEVDHPVPCECGTARCTVIAAFLKQHDESSGSSFSSDGECDT